jgi:hypothetical protein
MKNITARIGIGIPRIKSKTQPTVPTSVIRIAVILYLTVLTYCRLLHRHTSRHWTYILSDLQKNQGCSTMLDNNRERPFYIPAKWCITPAIAQTARPACNAA